MPLIKTWRKSKQEGVRKEDYEGLYDTDDEAEEAVAITQAVGGPRGEETKRDVSKVRGSMAALALHHPCAGLECRRPWCAKAQRRRTRPATRFAGRNAPPRMRCITPSAARPAAPQVFGGAAV